MLDRNFVRSLPHNLADTLPHGAMKEIAGRLGCSDLTARNACHGASTNVRVVREAIKSLITHRALIGSILEKVPAETLAELEKEAPGIPE